MSMLDQRSFYYRLGFVASVLFGLLYRLIWGIFVLLFAAIFRMDSLFDDGFFMVMVISLILPLAVFCIFSHLFVNFVYKHFEGESHGPFKIKVINIILYVVTAVGSFFIYFLY